MGWTIREVAAQTGISADTLRYYDKLGIISPKRHENGYRYYDENELSKLKYITVMKYAQLSLADIKTLVSLLDKEPSPTCNTLSKDILLAKSNSLRQTIINYQSIIALMDELLPMLDGIAVHTESKNEISIFVEQIFNMIQKGNV